MADEFDDFATLWRRDPSPEEQKALEAIARRVSRRARLAQHFEIGGGILVLIVIGVSLISSPVPGAIAAGLALGLAVIWSSWRRYRLAQAALLVDTSNRERLIESGIKSTEARLRRSRLGIWLLLPGYFLGAITKYGVVKGHLEGFWSALAQQTLPTSITGLATILLLGAAQAYFLRAHMAIASELGNLREVHRQYETESRLDNLV